MPVTIPLRHRFSRPSRHCSQTPQAQCSQATPTRSPTARCSTAAPFATTLPMTSWPGISARLRRRAKAGEVAVRDVQIGMADAADLDLDQHLVGLGHRRRHVLDAQRLTEVGKDGGFHGGDGERNTGAFCPRRAARPMDGDRRPSNATTRRITMAAFRDSVEMNACARHPSRRQALTVLGAAGLAAMTGCATGRGKPSPLTSALAPTGRLRACINLGNAVLARRDAAERTAGRRVGRPGARARRPARRRRPNSSSSTRAMKSVQAVRSGQADIGFFAIDPSRSEGLRFTAPYVLIEGAYLVRHDSPLTDNAQVDRAGTSVMVATGSAYDLFLTRELKAAQLVRTVTLAGRRRPVSRAARRRRRPPSSSSSRPTRRASATCACCRAASW